jgi:anti-anti-sigma factor
MAEDAFHIEQSGDVAIITPSSVVENLHLDLADQAAELVVGPISASNPTAVIIDLSRVKFFGSVFLSVLLKVWRIITQRGGNMVICGASKRARELLKLTQLDTLWALYDSRDEALEALTAE